MQQQVAQPSGGAVSEENVRFRLLGFRSNVLLKKIIAVAYYLAGLAILVLGLVTPPPFVPAGTAAPWDLAVYKFSMVFMYIWIMTPAIFLSESPLRRNLPFFRDKQRFRSIAGMVFVLAAFGFLFMYIQMLYTPEFRAAIDQFYGVASVPTAGG